MKNKQFPNIDPTKLKRSDLFHTINKCESDMSRNIAEHLDQNLNHYDEIKNEFYNYYTKFY